jgi:hypothetical protein
VQSLDCYVFDLMGSLDLSLSESSMIAIPPTPISYVLAAHLRSAASSVGQKCKVAVSGGRFIDWPALVLAMMTAINGWLTVGLVPQSALMAAAILRRLTGK